jgi:glycosyltransferase involved in cell wall biosynthesis
MSIANKVRSIMRAATRGQKLNILVINCTHERYEQTLCKTNHNFYVFQAHGSKEWNDDYGLKPSNYTILKYVPMYLDYDLIMIHASDDRMGLAIDLKNTLGIPLIRHTHTLPHNDSEKKMHQLMKGYVDMDSFISRYSMSEWGYDELFEYGVATYINHGIDVDFWSGGDDYERQDHCLSVVNFWKDRDWACGWNLWNKIKGNDLPVKVLGNNPGLSSPPATIEDLRKEYKSSLIFLNTSLHSPVPMSLLEAMAAGCAIVTTENCMIPEIILDGWNGISKNSPEELRAACETLLKEKELASILGKEAAKTIRENYNISQFVDNWNNLFKQVMYK